MAYTMSINLNESTFADLAVFVDAALENGADLDDGLLLNDGQLTVEIDTTLIAVEEDEFGVVSGFDDDEDYEDLPGYDDFADSERGTNIGGGNAMPGMSAAKESLREFFTPRDGFSQSAQSAGSTQSAGSAQSLRKWSEFGRNILQDLGREVENLSRDFQDRGADGGARGAFGDFNPADFDERLNQANYGDSADRDGDAVEFNGEDVDNRGNFGESVEKPGEEGKESDNN